MTNATDQLLAQARSILAQCIVAENAAAKYAAQAAASVDKPPINAAPIPIWGTFPKVSFPAGYTLASVVGYNDLYTVPPGRKAMVIDIFVTNTGAGDVHYKPFLKTSGYYYGIGSSRTETNSATGHAYGSDATSYYAPMLLNAGETFSVNSDLAGVSFWLYIVEFDAVCPINRLWFTNFTAGDNRIYTVPQGKTFYMGMSVGLADGNNPASIFTGFHYYNTSGGTRTLGGIYLVPSGGSPVAANAVVNSNSINNNLGFAKVFRAGMNPGDYISLNTDSGAQGTSGNTITTQIAWFNYVEVNQDGTFG